MAEENENGNKKDRVWEIITQGSIPDKTLVKLNDIFRNKGSGLDMWYMCGKIGSCSGLGGGDNGSVFQAIEARKEADPRSKKHREDTISTFRVADILFPDTKKALEEAGVQVEVTGYWEFNPIITTGEEEYPQTETGLDRLRGETSQCSQ